MLLVFERCESGAQSGNADRAAGDEEAGDVVEHVRIAECVADAKAGERICLRERPGHDHSSALVRETRCVTLLVEVGVGPVDEEQRPGVRAAPQVIEVERVPRRIVRRANHDDLRATRDSREQRVHVVRERVSIVGELHLHNARVERREAAPVYRPGRRRHDHLLSRAHECPKRCLDHLGRAGTEKDAGWLETEPVGERRSERRQGRRIEMRLAVCLLERSSNAR